jgi:glycosyltransferase involved in cell wall biosynthesis
MPVRVLHVVATVALGGVETWLCNLLPRFDRSKFQFDICYYRNSGSELKECMASAASDVFTIPLEDDVGGLANFIRRLRERIRRRKYDVVHCHGLSFVGAGLYCAWREDVNIRIAHSHATSEPARQFIPTMFLSLTKHAARRLATRRIGCSKEAAEALFGMGCLRNGASVLYCGVDLANGASMLPVSKESLGIPRSATTIGCVANFTPPKNHNFLLAIFARILRYDGGAHLILVGDGQNRAAIEEQAAMLGITDQVHLVGRRKDVPAFLSVFDVFALPSFTEGLPIALLEAQAQGVPCVTSSAVTRESEVITGLVKFIPLSADLDLWARTVMTMARAFPNRNSERSRLAFQSSPYNIDHAVSSLAQIYSHKNAGPERNVKGYCNTPFKTDHARD